tara:strand:+ start:2883 stop:3833 length:951 start_codon:yes stop_codon:yes gene_type:complete
MNIKEPKVNEEECTWTDECEKLLAEWSEKASCYRWLHGRCEKSYRNWYYCFSIPVIILSTLTGAANVGMDSFVPEENKSIASAIVGGVNIFAGIVSTLQNFLKVAELMEAHRIAGVSWGKLQRNISIELALDPSRRVIQSDFLKLSRAEYDRLIEAGPIIDDKVIRQFNKKFKNYEVSIPSICNGLDKCIIYKIDKNIEMNHNDFINDIEDIISDEEKIDSVTEPIVKVKGHSPKKEGINYTINETNKNDNKDDNKNDNKNDNKDDNDNTDTLSEEVKEITSLHKDTQTLDKKDEMKEGGGNDSETESFLEGIDGD